MKVLSLTVAYVILGGLSLLLYAPPLFLLLLDVILLGLAITIWKNHFKWRMILAPLLACGAVALIGRDLFLLFG